MATKKKSTKAKTPPMEFAEVRMSVGMTVPTGKYSSFRVDVGATVRHPDGPGYTRKEADVVLHRLEQYLENKVTEAAEEFRGEDK